MKSMVAFGLVLVTCVALAQFPALPKPKTKTTVLQSPKAISMATTTMKTTTVVAAAPKVLTMPNEDAPVFFVNYGPNYTGPMICGVNASNQMVLLVPVKTPMLYIPNKSTAAFAMLQSSPDLKTWTTLGYLTNYLNGVYIADVTATNKSMYFYRLVPQ